MKLLGIEISILSDNRFLTVIRFINTKGRQDEANRTDLHLQGVEEFIRNFRIRHGL